MYTESLIFFVQFQDHDFPGLSGARVVRIATHPEYQGVSKVVEMR